MTFILVLVVAIAVLFAVFVLMDIDIDEGFIEGVSKYNPFIHYRKINTPSCRTCVHGRREFVKPNRYNGTMQKSHKFLCECPEAIDVLERKDGTVYDAVLSEKVRGRMYCKHTPINQTENSSGNENGTDEKEM